MNQTTTPISSLSIGDIVKIPSLPNINQMTILNINQCGTRVKGSESSIEQEGKVSNFDHNISNATPVIKIGVDEGILNKSLDKEKNDAKLLSTQKVQPVENQETNNMQDQNSQSETPVVETSSTAVNNTVKAIAQTVEVTKQIADAKNTPNYARPTGSFSTRQFAELNQIEYANAAAFLKQFAKVVGKQSAGRGRPTVLYSFE